MSLFETVSDHASGDFPKQMNWTVVDLVFGIIAASLPVLNAAIPKRWRSPSNSIPTPHTFKPFAINTDRGSRRLESDERIHHNQIQGHQGTANNNTSAGEKGSVVPVTLETRPAPELQIPTPTYRDHFKDESMTGDGLV